VIFICHGNWNPHTYIRKGRTRRLVSTKDHGPVFRLDAPEHGDKDIPAEWVWSKKGLYGKRFGD